METKLYRINRIFAAKNKLPIYFVANRLVTTNRAVYLYGQGTTETTKMGCCCVCGRTLTHPVSVELGIGPECGSHWWDWDLIGGYTKENIERLKGALRDVRVDSWIPNSCIIEELNTTDVVLTPADHPMLSKPITNNSKKATLVTRQNTGQSMIKIEFPYDISLISKIKEIRDRRFVNEGSAKYWITPLTAENVELLTSLGFSIDPALQTWVMKSRVRIETVTDIEIPGLKGELFPFQKRGVAFLEAKDGRALIADEMGLGKTIQALAYLQLHPELRPAIIVVPASLKLNWEKEIHSWMSKPRTQILNGTNDNVPITGEIIIINYDILPYWLDVLKLIKPQVLITDECHYYKSNSANRTKAVKELGKSIPHVIALSGTPIVNRPIEIYNALSLIDKTVIPSFWNYVTRYCGARNNGYGWDFSGATNTQELHDRLIKTIMIRRKKSDVLTDLPDKIRDFLPMELDNQKDYYKAESDFIAFVKERKGAAAANRASNAEALAEIEGLKQLAVQGKLKQAIDWIIDFLEVDGKLVVFATHKFVIDRLMETFPKIAVKVDGSVTGEGRQKAVDDFQNNPDIRLFVGNIQAAGVGITLTAASNVAFLELPWTPGALVQAEDRCHRIGQKDSVTIHYLLATGTIEERIACLIDKKRKVLDKVLDGIETDEESLLSELINDYNN